MSAQEDQKGININRRQQQILFGVENVDNPTKNGLYFLSSPFASLSLPHRKTWSTKVVTANGGEKVEELIHRVSNGRETLIVEGSPSFGLPYGTYPRLFHFYICAEIKRTGNATIVINSSLPKFMQELGFTGQGAQKKLFFEQVLRFINATYRFERKGEDGVSVVKADSPVSGYNLESVWFKRKKTDEVASITFKDWFVDEIMGSAIPYQKEAIKSLRGSSLALDLYAWIAWRSHTLNRSPRKQATIKLEDFAYQFGLSYSRDCDLKRDLKKAYREVKALYPEAQFFITPSGITLHGSKETVSSNP